MSAKEVYYEARDKGHELWGRGDTADEALESGVHEITEYMDPGTTETLLVYEVRLCKQRVLVFDDEGHVVPGETT